MRGFEWRHILYRLWGTDGELLYVGVTNSLNRRLCQHAGSQSWWLEVADCTIEFHPNRGALLEAERCTIAIERPRYNVEAGGPAERSTTPSSNGSTTLLNCRVENVLHDAVTELAAEATGGNKTAAFRRMLQFSAREMPAGWWPDDPDFLPQSTVKPPR